MVGHYVVDCYLLIYIHHVDIPGVHKIFWQQHIFIEQNHDNYCSIYLSLTMLILLCLIVVWYIKESRFSNLDFQISVSLYVK